jgi:hypothetical protein
MAAACEEEAAIALFEKALVSDPLHPEATFNFGIMGLRASLISDEALLGKLRIVADADPTNSIPLRLVARVHLEMGRNESALLTLQSAESLASEEMELRAIQRLRNLASESTTSSLRPEIARPFVLAALCTGAEYSRHTAHMKRLLHKAYAAHKSGRALDARRYLVRLREIPGLKLHPKVQQLEQLLGSGLRSAQTQKSAKRSDKKGLRE